MAAITESPKSKTSSPDTRNAPSGDSVSDLYASMCRSLADYLEQHFGVEIRFAKLPDLLGLIVASQNPVVKHGMVIADDTTDAQRIYLYVHVAAHVLLGHLDRPFASLLEPRRGPQGPTIELTERDISEDRDANALARAMFWGCSGHTCDVTVRNLPYVNGDSVMSVRDSTRYVSSLLLGERRGKSEALRKALQLGFTRKTILLWLRLTRAAYHRLGEPMADEPLARGLRELYCLTEVVSVTPQLLPTSK